MTDFERKMVELQNRGVEAAAQGRTKLADTYGALIRAEREAKDTRALQFNASQMRDAGSFGRLERRLQALYTEIDSLRATIRLAEMANL